MADLTGHDHMPSAFLVYLYLWGATRGPSAAPAMSYRNIASATGLSQSAVFKSVKHLLRRRLIRRSRSSKTVTSEYVVNTPWRAR